MKLEGGCYCKELRYVAEGEPMAKAQCHRCECQYISGGAPNMVMAMPSAGFRYTKGTPKQFTRTDLQQPATREFCPDCGTHILARVGAVPSLVSKRGRWTIRSSSEIRRFHRVPEGIPTFERMPTRD